MKPFARLRFVKSFEARRGDRAPHPTYCSYGEATMPNSQRTQHFAWVFDRDKSTLRLMREELKRDKDHFSDGRDSDGRAVSDSIEYDRDRKYGLLELFCGAGLGTLGAVRNNLEIIAAVDKDKTMLDLMAVRFDSRFDLRLMLLSLN